MFNGSAEQTVKVITLAPLKKKRIVFSKTGQEQSSELVRVLTLDPFKVLNGTVITRFTETAKTVNKNILTETFITHDKPNEHNCHIVKEGPY